MAGGRGKGGEKKWRGKERQREGESKGKGGGKNFENNMDKPWKCYAKSKKPKTT